MMGIDAIYLLLPKAKNETLEVTLRANADIVMSIFFPNFTSFAELVAQMP